MRDMQRNKSFGFLGWLELRLDYEYLLQQMAKLAFFEGWSGTRKEHTQQNLAPLRQAQERLYARRKLMYPVRHIQHYPPLWCEREIEVEDGARYEHFHVFQSGGGDAGEHYAIYKELHVGIAYQAKLDHLQKETLRFGSDDDALGFMINTKAGGIRAFRRIERSPLSEWDCEKNWVVIAGAESVLIYEPGECGRNFGLAEPAHRKRL